MTDPTPTLRVTTASGTVFEIDEEARWLRRIPAAAEPTDGFETAGLRRDGEWIKYHFAGRIRLGHPLTFLVEPLGDPNLVVATTRVSTPVVRLERPTTDA